MRHSPGSLPSRPARACEGTVSTPCRWHGETGLQAPRRDSPQAQHRQIGPLAPPLTTSQPLTQNYAPPLLLPTGAALLGSRLLPRAFAWAAMAFGAISFVLGLAALFSAAAFSAAIVLIIAQNLWVLAAALVLLARGPSAPTAPAPARQAPHDIPIHRTAH